MSLLIDMLFLSVGSNQRAISMLSPASAGVMTIWQDKRDW